MSGNGLRGCVLLLFLFWLPGAQAAAEATPSGVQVGVTSSGGVAPEAEPEKRKTKNNALFWIVLALSLLFVVGSATALNALGGKHSAPRNRNRSNGQGPKGFDE